MTVDYVRMLYEYNRWANHRVLDCVESVGPENVTRDLKSSFPSILDTLIHILSSEWVWLSRWKGVSPTGFPDAARLADVAAIRSRWSGVEGELATFVSGLSDEQIRTDISYRNTRGESFIQPLADQLCHVVNHSSYHRGQIATMLRQVGEVPVSTDMIVFLRTQSPTHV